MPNRDLNFFGTYLSGLPDRSFDPTSTRPLLDVLAAHSDTMPYRELWTAAFLLGYLSDEFASAFQTLRQTGAVQVTGAEAINATVQLTRLGKSVAAVDGREGL